VLLAGNGHARKDIGVPRWLAVPSTSIALGRGRRRRVARTTITS
jgi:hypothetical protein